MQYQIISDSSCDLPPILAEKVKVEIVPFYVSFNSSTYQKENVDIPVQEFYQEMINRPKVYPKSSLPSIQDFLDVFTPHVKNGMPIICICITTKFSGSFSSALNAKSILLEEHPNAKITVIDSTFNTVLQGLFVLEAVRMQQNDHSYEYTVSALENLRPTGRIIFTIGSLEYLKAGGRIGKLKGLAADTLGIKPLIVLKEGEIFQNGLTRNRKKSKLKLIAQFHEHFREINDSPENYQLTIGYGYDYEEAVSFRNELMTSLKNYPGITDIPLYQIGATIAVHTGPHPLGIGLVRKYDATACSAEEAAFPLLQRAHAVLHHAKSQVAHATEHALNQAGQAKEQVSQVTGQAKDQVVTNMLTPDDPSLGQKPIL